MKTLDQIEPRTPIGTLPFTITTRGSYYLTKNLTGVAGQDGIVIEADDVTLDLGGFALVGVTGSGDGIQVARAVKNLSLRNGTVRNWGGAGIAAALAARGQARDLRVADNAGTGLELGSAASVSQCTAASNGGDGIVVGSGSAVTDCVATGNSGDGLVADLGSTIRHCTLTDNTGDAIQVTHSAQVVGNTCRGNGAGSTGAGVHATGNANRIEDNHLTANGRGLLIEGTGNIVANNTVKANAGNYQIAQGNQLHILLCEIPQNIVWPATVTLAGSFNGIAGAGGIGVAVDDVTIDLNGFSLIGAPGGTSGIVVSGQRRNLTVRNGTLRNWPANGVDAATVENGLFEQLRLFNNGAVGLVAGAGALVRDCVARGNGTGFSVSNGARITDCTATSNQGAGFVVDAGTMITGCTASFNAGDGIRAGNSCQVQDNTCFSNINFIAAAGIRVTGSDNSIKANLVLQNDRGLSVDAARNFIVHNTAKNNSINYVIADPTSQTLGQIVRVADNINEAPPWANFDFGQPEP